LMDYKRKHGKHQNPALCSALNKHTEENIIMYLLWKVDLDVPEDEAYIQALIMEMYYIWKFDSFKNGYNCTTGGDAPFEVSEETRLKISINAHNQNGANNCMWGKFGELNPFFGKKHTEETRKIISNKLKGRFSGDKGFFYGKHHTEENKKILSDRHSKWWKIAFESGHIEPIIKHLPSWCNDYDYNLSAVKHVYSGIKNCTGINRGAFGKIIKVEQVEKE
jgi:group I intron endonuclease